MAVTLLILHGLWLGTFVFAALPCLPNQAQLKFSIRSVLASLCLAGHLLEIFLTCSLYLIDKKILIWKWQSVSRLVL